MFDVYKKVVITLYGSRFFVWKRGSHFSVTSPLGCAKFSYPSRANPDQLIATPSIAKSATNATPAATKTQATITTPTRSGEDRLIYQMIAASSTIPVTIAKTLVWDSLSTTLMINTKSGKPTII